MLTAFIRTIILYLVVIFSMRLMGKRQIGELQPSELAITIMISEVASIPLENSSVPLLDGIIPVLSLVIFEIFLSFILLKSKTARKIVTGIPSVVIQDGIIDEHELSHLRFNLDDLTEELRLAGYPDISTVQYAILETTGKLSIIPKPENAPTILKDLGKTPGKSGLPISLIQDGEIQDESLGIIGKNKSWLIKKLKANNITDYKKIFIATIDSEGSLFVQQNKD